MIVAAASVTVRVVPSVWILLCVFSGLGADSSQDAAGPKGQSPVSLEPRGEQVEKHDQEVP